MGSEKRLDRITALDLERYQVQRLNMRKKKGSGPITGSTVNLELLYLSHILKRANLWSKICVNYKRLPKNKQMIGQAISQAKFVHLVETAQTNPVWLVAFCSAVLSASGTGQRGIEIKKLRLQDIRISEEEAWIVIPHGATKTDAGCREIPLNGIARWALQRLLERARLAGATEPCHFLLPKDRSKHTRRDDPHRGETGFDPTDHQSTWRTAWVNLCKKAGLAGLRFHDMRHLFITQAAEADVPLQVIESLVGHLSAEMVRHYTHIRSAAKQKAVEAIDRQQEMVMQVLRGDPRPGTISVDTDH